MVKEKFWNVPNTITTIRLVSTFFIIYLIFTQVNFIIIAIAFAIFALTDVLDGNLARILKQKTEIGAKLDMIADKIFFGGTAISLIINYLITKEEVSSILLLTTIPKAYILLIISRELIGFPAFVYLIITNRAFTKVRVVGKITTVLQGITIVWLISKMPFVIYPILLTAFVGTISALAYWYDVAKAKPIKYVKKKIKGR